MRDFLDRLYLGAAWLAAFLILAIAVLVSAQVLLNLATRVFALPLPSSIPSYADFSGFMLAAATFLAMAHTFRAGGHIRVSLITARLPLRLAFLAELVALALAAALTGYACWYILALILESWEYNDVSPGIVPVPLWAPQSVMGVGMGLLFVAVVDSLIETLIARAPVIAGGEEA